MIELLVVIAIIALLAAILFPALSSAKAKAQRVKCTGNLKQISLAMQLYADDNRDWLPSNGFAPPNYGAKMWVLGDGHWNPPTFTNLDLMLDSRHALFADYIRTAEIYKCPSDRSTVTLGQKKFPKVRSYALNSYLAWTLPTAYEANFHPDYRRFEKSTDLAGATPSELFTFIDVSPRFVCHPGFVVIVGSRYYYHMQSTQHENGGVIAFADGHADYRRWRESQTRRETKKGDWIESHLFFDGLGNRDMLWLHERASVKKSPAPGANPP